MICPFKEKKISTGYDTIYTDTTICMALTEPGVISIGYFYKLYQPRDVQSIKITENTPC